MSGHVSDLNAWEKRNIMRQSYAILMCSLIFDFDALFYVFRSVFPLVLGMLRADKTWIGHQQWDGALPFENWFQRVILVNARQCKMQDIVASGSLWEISQNLSW